MDVYGIDGKVARSIELPRVFSESFRKELVLRAILAEQSLRYQPKGRNLMAGLRTTATYVGNYKSYRTGRHMGIAIRPREKLGGGAMGYVRRIPSSVKGRRAHAQKVEKRLIESINSKEYILALKSAIGGFSDSALVKSSRNFEGRKLPIVVDNKIESVAKTKELISILQALGIGADLEKSHKPKTKGDMRSKQKRRSYRNSAIIIIKNAEKIGKAGRNIPGVDVCSIDKLTVEKLSPGGAPRISIWSEDAVKGVEEAVSKASFKRLSSDKI
jgi:large subunit ribosomal protein L4e